MSKSFGSGESAKKPSSKNGEQELSSKMRTTTEGTWFLAMRVSRWIRYSLRRRREERSRVGMLMTNPFLLAESAPLFKPGTLVR